MVRPENLTAPIGKVWRPAPEEEEVVGAIVGGLGKEDEGRMGEGVFGGRERICGLARTGESGVGKRLGRKTDADGKELASSQEDDVVFMLGFRWRHYHEVGIVKPMMMETVLLEVTRPLSAQGKTKSDREKAESTNPV